MKVKVPKNYRCPFCSDHKDDVFHTTSIIDSPICEGCHEELYIFSHCDENERPDDPMISIWEEKTGLKWSEIRKKILKESYR